MGEIKQDQVIKREWFFEKTNDYEYKNEEHKEDMYQYVNYMIYGGTKPNTKDEYIDRGVYKYIEQEIEQYTELQYIKIINNNGVDY